MRFSEPNPGTVSGPRAGLALLVVGAAVLAAGPAFAHTGLGAVHGFSHGFAHPLGGLDHVLAMVAVGMWAGVVGGRALWAYPLAFMGFMVVGGLLGIAGIALPAVEVAIALSVVLLGTAVALRLDVPAAIGAAICAGFALFHGYAHGAEMDPAAGAAAYAAGFVLATGLLHLAGIGTGLLATRLPLAATRLAGGAVALAGVALLVG